VCWNKDFIGRRVVEREKESGPKKTLIAFMLESGIPRQNFDIMLSGQKIGRVASGTFSPTLKKGIGTGFSSVPLEPGAEIQILIHNQLKSAKIVKKPFYKRLKK
jgi:aminomethyltransferase